MDITRLQYFKTTAGLANVTRAAQVLHITQSALSSSIRRLEEEVGAPLFDRDGRKIALNKNGEKFLRHAEVILSEYESALDELRSPISVSDEHVLSIAATATDLPRRLLTEFKLAHPDVVVRQRFLPADRPLLEAVRARGTDLVLSTEPVSAPDVDCILVSEEMVFLIVDRGHPLAKKKIVRMAELGGVDFVALPEGYYSRVSMEKMFRELDIPLHIAAECFEAQIPQMVLDGVGAGFLHESAVRSGSLPEDIVIIPVADDFCRRFIYLIRRAGSARLRPVVRKYLAFLSLSSL